MEGFEVEKFNDIINEFFRIFSNIFFSNYICSFIHSLERGYPMPDTVLDVRYRNINKAWPCSQEARIV